MVSLISIGVEQDDDEGRIAVPKRVWGAAAQPRVIDQQSAVALERKVLVVPLTARARLAQPAGLAGVVACSDTASLGQVSDLKKELALAKERASKSDADARTASDAQTQALDASIEGAVALEGKVLVVPLTARARLAQAAGLAGVGACSDTASLGQVSDLKKELALAEERASKSDADARTASEAQQVLPLMNRALWSCHCHGILTRRWACALAAGGRGDAPE